MINSDHNRKPKDSPMKKVRNKSKNNQKQNLLSEMDLFDCAL